jgi:hypothetical protein
LPASRTAPVNGSVEPDVSGSGREGSRCGRGGVASRAADFGRADGFGREVDFALVLPARAAGFARLPPARALDLAPPDFAPALARLDFALAFARAALARVDGEAFEEEVVAPAVAPRFSLRCPGRDLGRLPSTPCSSLLSAATREK